MPFTLIFHAYASTAGDGSAPALATVVGVLDGQPKVLYTSQQVFPLAPGNYKARLIQDASPHGAEIQRIYELQFPDGTQRRFNVIGICAKGSTQCHGVSIPSQSPTK